MNGWRRFRRPDGDQGQSLTVERCLERNAGFVQPGLAAESSPREAPRLRGRLRAFRPHLRLDYAAAEFEPYLRPSQICLERQNLLRLPEVAKVADMLAGTNLISCCGLFDYLDDNQAIRMLGFFHAVLATGGRGLVFHFSINNSTRAYMEWVADWYLNYRTADEFFGLAKAAEIPVDWPIDSLVEGTALYLDWSKA